MSPRITPFALPFGVLAVIGLAISLAVHASTYWSFDILGAYPAAWLLHIGVFLVLLPLAGKQKDEPTWPEPTSDATEGPGLRLLIGSMAFFFPYALVNFLVSAYLLSDGSANQLDDGTFALLNHGDFVRALTEAEYHRFRAYEARLFSGHWMLFYAHAAALLFSAVHEEDQQAAESEGLAGPVAETA